MVSIFKVKNEKLITYIDLSETIFKFSQIHQSQDSFLLVGDKYCKVWSFEVEDSMFNQFTIGVQSDEQTIIDAQVLESTNIVCVLTSSGMLELYKKGQLI